MDPAATQSLQRQSHELSCSPTAQPCAVEDVYRMAPPNPVCSAQFTCPRVRFGRTELQMPIITCGGMRMQQTWQPPEDFTLEHVTSDCQNNFEAIVDRAMELGINHFETARGYGTSEIQYGRALKRHPREAMIVQTKVKAFEDPEEFRRTLETSLSNLDTHVDLLGIHGINREDQLEWTLREGGCMDVAREYQREGKVKFIGFSTHAPTPVIVKAIESDQFDYVNLHYHFIGSYTSSGTGGATSGNLEAVRAATERDMGIFIISPSDKGGMLYKPPRRLSEACAPLSPLAFNDMWLWSQRSPAIHTLVVGAARPTDFDEHVDACRHFMGQSTLASSPEAAQELVRTVEMRLRDMESEALGKEWATTWWKGLPGCYATPLGVHVAQIVWLWGLIKAFGLHEYAKTQYAKLEAQLPLWDRALSKEENWLKVPFDWTPGNPFTAADADELATYLPAERRDTVLEILREAHDWMGQDSSQVDEAVRREGGWDPAYDMQPDKPFPERG